MDNSSPLLLTTPGDLQVLADSLSPVLEAPPSSKPTGSGSSIATLLPHSPSVDLSAQGAKSPNSTKGKLKPKRPFSSKDNRSIQIAPGLYKANDYKKYLTVVLDDTEADIFDIHRDLVPGLA